LSKQVKLQCLACDDVHYLNDEDVVDVVPDGAAPGEAFKAHCPFCKSLGMVTLAQ